MNIKTSLYFRTKSWIDQYEKNEISKKYSLSSIDDLSLETLIVMQSIKAISPSFNTLIDIGAHKGLFTKAANLFFKIDLSLCFEPNVEMIKKISENTKNFNIEINSIALSEKEEDVLFYKHEDSSMNSILKGNVDVLKEKFPWDNPDKITSSKVKSMPLDVFISNRKLGSDTNFFLKIDTQGNELEILKGSRKTLLQTSVCVIEQMFVEAYQGTSTFQELINFMSDNRFKCKGPVSISYRPNKEVSSVDFLFVKD